jgi:hypothetical protein
MIKLDQEEKALFADWVGFTMGTHNHLPLRIAGLRRAHSIF